jgi:hypothetical protein
MNQDFIVYAIVLFTIGNTIYMSVKNLRTKKVVNSCGGCNGCDISKNMKCSDK